MQSVTLRLWGEMWDAVHYVHWTRALLSTRGVLVQSLRFWSVISPSPRLRHSDLRQFALDNWWQSRRWMPLWWVEAQTFLFWHFESMWSKRSVYVCAVCKCVRPCVFTYGCTCVGVRVWHSVEVTSTAWVNSRPSPGVLWQASHRTGPCCSAWHGTHQTSYTGCRRCWWQC